MAPGDERRLSLSTVRAERSIKQIIEIRQLTLASRRIIAESLSLLRATQPQWTDATPLWRQRRR